MNYNELISSFLIDLQSYFRRNISYPRATQQQILSILVIPFDGIEMTQLAKKIGIKNSTLTRLVDGLIKKNWALKKPIKNDRRVIKVFLSKSGMKVQNDLNFQISEAGSELEKSLGEDISQNVIEKVSLLHWEIVKSHLNSK
ncbi:MarR family transcriptional regulator [Candidatus Marinimicrobia bacterium]|jgi:DNA-binding MarR family transcriptional regulator|nr:MarR family transcriptional regulator [Candidatus Neomarinimicrobiota bacterium]MDC0384372.1 MarR family transcriptional regulator [Candidatus Neomarinimicrobiota bacterium]